MQPLVNILKQLMIKGLLTLLKQMTFSHMLIILMVIGVDTILLVLLSKDMLEILEDGYKLSEQN